MVKLQDLVELFIASNKLNNDFDEILRLVCVKLLVGFDIESVIFCALEKNGSIRPNSYFGIDIETLGFPSQGFYLYERTPCSDAIKDHSTVFIDTLPKLPDEYADTFQASIPDRIKSLASIPISYEGRTFGTILCFSTRRTLKSQEIREVLDVVGLTCGAMLVNHNNHVPDTFENSERMDTNHSIKLLGNDRGDTELTERQRLILQMISDGRTNGDIADLLGYSESLIRQETIRIYARLKCSGRAEAIRIYRASQPMSAAL